MAQFADRQTASNRDPQSQTAFVCLLEERLQGYQSLAASLLRFREAYVRNDLREVLRQIDAQSSCCSRIAAAETALGKRSQSTPRDRNVTQGLPGDEAQRIQKLLTETASARSALCRLNRVYARIVEKAALRNAILRNLYANALVYGDPRTFARGPRRWLEG